MTSTYDPCNVQALVEEYSTYVEEASHRRNGREDSLELDRLEQLLKHDGAWTAPAAAALIDVSHQYGVSFLRNALALAVALGIEDGELGY